MAVDVRSRRPRKGLEAPSVLKKQPRGSHLSPLIDLQSSNAGGKRPVHIWVVDRTPIITVKN